MPRFVTKREVKFFLLLDDGKTQVPLPERISYLEEFRKGYNYTIIGTEKERGIINLKGEIILPFGEYTEESMKRLQSYKWIDGVIDKRYLVVKKSETEFHKNIIDVVLGT